MKNSAETELGVEVQRAELEKKQHLPESARKDFQMRHLQLKILPVKGHCRTAAVLEQEESG